MARETTRSISDDINDKKDFNQLVALDHTHKIVVPDHTHKVVVVAHTHQVTIPSHTHEITLPSHTHNVIYRIVGDVIPQEIDMKTRRNLKWRKEQEVSLMI